MQLVLERIILAETTVRFHVADLPVAPQFLKSIVAI